MGDKMSVVEGVAEARHMANFLLSNEFRGPGDTIEAAAYRAEARWGVPASIIQRLRHRDVSDMLLSNWWRLKAAYEAARVQAKRVEEHQQFLTREAGIHEGNSIIARGAALVAGAKDGAAK